MLTPDQYDDLAKRVLQFDCMELPGQLHVMHMGTSYLVHDLWNAVKTFQDAATKSYADAPISIHEHDNGEASNITPREVLISILRELDNGKHTPDVLIVMFGNADAGTVGIRLSAPNAMTRDGLISQAQYLMHAAGDDD